MKSIPSKQAEKVWAGLLGELELNEEQARYCRGVKRVYLDWRTAPDSYIEQYLPQLLPSVLNEWRVGPDNKPFMPASKAGWDFARKWGLWKNGRPSEIVTGKQVVLFH